MINRIYILILLTAILPGCADTVYIHDDYVNGVLVRHIRADYLRNAYDTKATSATLKFPDGATLNITAPSGQADPNFISAAQTFGQALLAWGATAIKVVGVIP